MVKRCLECERRDRLCFIFGTAIGGAVIGGVIGGPYGAIIGFVVGFVGAVAYGVWRLEI